MSRFKADDNILSIFAGPILTPMELQQKVAELDIGVLPKASLIDHHRLLVIGGSDGCSDLESTELLDLMLGTCA